MNIQMNELHGINIRDKQLIQIETQQQFLNFCCFKWGFRGKWGNIFPPTPFWLCIVFFYKFGCFENTKFVWQNK